MKDDISQYIDWFRNSSAYINAHRGKVFVLLLTGEALQHSNFSNIIYDINLLNSLGVKLVLVHGARPQISAALKSADIESNYHNNLRVSDPVSVDTIKQTVGQLSIDLEALLSLGLVNSPMHKAAIKMSRGNFITAKPYGIHDGVDFCNTGLVRKVQQDAIQQQLSLGNIVLMSNLGYSPTGEVFNLSAEEVATETAIALDADKLILFVPGQGVTDSNGNLISSLSLDDASDHLNTTTNNGAEDQEVINHAIRAAVKAGQGNVKRVHLISHQHNGALLRELFTRQGTGTLVSNDGVQELRQAQHEDVAGILELIKPLEQAGTLVERSRELLESEIANFKVVSFEGMIVACAALYPFDDGYGEIACMAIHPEFQNQGHGNQLLNSLEKEATEQKLSNVFILTTAANHWFLENGFTEIELSQLPEKKKQLYNFQRNSKVLIKPI